MTIPNIATFDHGTYVYDEFYESIILISNINSCEWLVFFLCYQNLAGSSLTDRIFNFLVHILYITTLKYIPQVLSKPQQCGPKCGRHILFMFGPGKFGEMRTNQKMRLWVLDFGLWILDFELGYLYPRNFKRDLLNRPLRTPSNWASQFLWPILSLGSWGVCSKGLVSNFLDRSGIWVFGYLFFGFLGLGFRAPTVWLSSASTWGTKSIHSSERSWGRTPRVIQLSPQLLKV